MWNICLIAFQLNESMDCEIEKIISAIGKRKGVVRYEKANEKVGFFYYNKLS